MPVPTDGLVEITLTGSLYDVGWQNVFYYHDSGNNPITDMPGIATDFNAKIALELITATSDDCLYQTIKVRDVLGQVPDFEQPTSSTQGQLADQSLPPFNAVRIDLSVFTKETRRGYKRFVGVPESRVTDGFLTTTAQAEWESVRANLDEALNASGTGYQAVVFGGPIPTDPLRKVVNIITTPVLQNRITSQVSRKP